MATLPEKNELTVEMGRRIYQRRKQLGLTQEQTADRSDLSHQYFAALERGEKGIAARNIIKLAKALEVSTDYLLIGADHLKHSYGVSEWAPFLNAKQTECLENIITNYLIACGFDKQNK